MEFDSALKNIEDETKIIERRLKSVSNGGIVRWIVLVNEVSKLEDGLEWIGSHLLRVDQVEVVLKVSGLESSMVLNAEDLGKKTCPPILHEISSILSLKSHQLPSWRIYAIPQLELTTTVVSLLHHSKVDLVFIVGCRSISRGEYENVHDFQPLVEEIILKEAIQPVILYK